MANERVTPATSASELSDRVAAARKAATAKLTHEFTESNTYERIAHRCQGLQSIATLATVGMEEGSLTDQVWMPLFGFLEVLADDIQRDAELLWREGLEPDKGLGDIVADVIELAPEDRKVVQMFMDGSRNGLNMDAASLRATSAANLRGMAGEA